MARTIGFTAEQTAEALRLYVDEGWSYERIGERFGVSLHTIRYHLLAVGVQPRRTGRPCKGDRAVVEDLGFRGRWVRAGLILRPVPA